MIRSCNSIQSNWVKSKLNSEGQFCLRSNGPVSTLQMKTRFIINMSYMDHTCWVQRKQCKTKFSSSECEEVNSMYDCFPLNSVKISKINITAPYEWNKRLVYLSDSQCTWSVDSLWGFLSCTRTSVPPNPNRLGLATKCTWWIQTRKCVKYESAFRMPEEQLRLPSKRGLTPLCYYSK